MSHIPKLFTMYVVNLINLSKNVHAYEPCNIITDVASVYLTLNSQLTYDATSPTCVCERFNFLASTRVTFRAVSQYMLPLTHMLREQCISYVMLV